MRMTLASLAAGSLLAALAGPAPAAELHDVAAAKAQAAASGKPILIDFSSPT